MENIQRIRFASKGLAVAPGRITKGEPWTETLIHLSNLGRDLGKQVCLHTHINHPREITWVTKKAANYLFKHGVIVRNQAVLLKGVNNTFETLSELIQTLTKINIQPVSVVPVETSPKIVSHLHTVLRVPMRHGKRH
jgi:lysine 2,3-aminomutase